MAGACYIADPEAEVRIVALDGLSLLFHEPSGTTHILAAPAPEILEALRAGAADAAELIRRLRARFELAEGEAEDAIHARLDELQAAGLVRRA